MYTKNQIISIGGIEFKIIGFVNSHTLEVVSTDPVPKGFKPKPQTIDISQIDK
tara:strand:- start:2076 stop:2234 length:159 start_codon:yes stop_codon:yes gene_type:complete